MRLSLATRIFVGYAVVLVTFGAVSIYSVLEMRRSQEEIRLVSEGYLHLSQDTAALVTFQQNREKDTRRQLDEKSPETKRELVRLSRLYFPPLITERLASAKDSARAIEAFAPPGEQAFVREISAKLDDLTERYQQYEGILEHALVPEIDEATRAQRLQVVVKTEGSLGREIRMLQAKLESRIRERVELADVRARQSGIAIVAFSLFAIAVGLAVMAIAARTLRPIRTLTLGVSRIARGDYTAKIGLTGEDEISVLGREFDAMARSLAEREAQLREKQEALLRAEQLAAVGRISAQVAHEVRNPLSSIGLNVELLEEALGRANFEEPREAEEAKEIVGSLNREVDRLTEITEEYLRMARVPRPQLEPEDLNGVVSSVVEFARHELERARVEISLELSPDLPRALVDEGQLRQVFLNLLRNSREAMGAGGRLTVRSGAVNGKVEVTFQDSGHGMTGEVRERIFEPFFSTKEGGTGLGLAVSRQIVQAHGGSIECHSAPGSGTTFVIRLPRA